MAVLRLKAHPQRRAGLEWTYTGCMPNETFTLRSAMPASAAEVYAWHSRPAAFARLLPPWERIEIIRVVGLEMRYEHTERE